MHQHEMDRYPGGEISAFYHFSSILVVESFIESTIVLN